MGKSSFEDLRVFQRALDLMEEVYVATAAFPKTELYGFTSQLRRAASSVVANIAEGAGRFTYGERRHMLSIARGSAYEVQAHVIAATRLHFLDDDAAARLRASAAAVGQMLTGLIRYVHRRDEAANTRRNSPPIEQRVTR